MTNTITQSQTVELDPLGLTTDDWANIAKTATVEAIDGALNTIEPMVPNWVETGLILPCSQRL
jgi:hypothetical protein